MLPHALHSHGIRSIADGMISKFTRGLKAYRHRNQYCDSFGRFWGVFGSVPLTLLSVLFLYWLALMAFTVVCSVSETWSEQLLNMYLLVVGKCVAAKGDPIHVVFDTAIKVNRFILHGTCTL